VGYNGERDTGVAEFGVGAEIPAWDARQGDILSARFGVVGARQRLAASEIDLLARLAGALGEYEAARVQLETFRDRIVPDARRAFTQTGDAYRAGNATFLDMLDAQRTLSDARVTLAELTAEAAEARAAVAGIVGPEGLLLGVRTLQSAAEVSTTSQRPAGAEVGP
jgi:cobalt-zinc-cadmium efflux system outer membrane protein